jgi:hypothetical protein
MIFRSSHSRLKAVLVASMIAGSVFCGTALAAEGSSPEMKVVVGLSSQPKSDAAISMRFKLISAFVGSLEIPALRSFSFSGATGALNLRRVPSCRPSGGTLKSGCATPIGSGQFSAYRRFDQVEGAAPLKLRGTVQIYSGGQRGSLSRLFAWMSFKEAGELAPLSFVIPIAVKRRGPAESAFTLAVPKLERGEITISELSLRIHPTVAVSGKPTPVTTVDCPLEQGADVRAEASFFEGAPPIDSDVIPACGG